jgi:cytochrome c-type biogenesis protein CcmH/NrfG
MGNLLFESGHARHALKYHQQALKFNPKELHAIVGIANALYDLEEP